MAIAQVYSWHLNPGRLADFMADAKRVDKIIRGLGGQTRTLNSVSGGTAGAVLYIVEAPDWKAFGDLNAKLETDKNWQALLAELTSTDKPTAELISSAIYSEIPLG